MFLLIYQVNIGVTITGLQVDDTFKVYKLQAITGWNGDATGSFFLEVLQQ